MLHLSSQLHKYWDEGVFGLKPLNYVSRPKSIPRSDVGKGKTMDGVVDDEEPQEIEHGIKICFHWLPATSLEHMKVDNPHPCTKDPRSLFVPIPSKYSEGFRVSSGPPATRSLCGRIS